MRRALALLLVVLAGAPTLAATTTPLAGPWPAHGWDDDGVPIPWDRCPDRGLRERVDNDGCPIDPEGPWGDLDGDFLHNGRDVALPREAPLAAWLLRSNVVHGVLRDGRLLFFGEASAGTDPRAANTDRLDFLADGFEVALRHGVTDAARSDHGAFVVEPRGAARADPRAPDEYLEVRAALVGTKTWWNDALAEGLRRVVADDLAPEGNDTYEPPRVRLHAWVEAPVALPDETLLVEEVEGTDKVPAQVAQHVHAARAPFVTYVIVAPRLEWRGVEVAGLAFGRWVLVAVEPKGFDDCEAEGGAPGTPACERLAELFRWTLNHERFHRYGLPDRRGGDDLMSTVSGVHAARPHESAARFAWIEARQDSLVRAWR